MSGWGWSNLFGGNSAAPKEVPKNAILGLRGTLDMLEKRERHLQQQMDEQDAIARKNVTTNKTAAKAALRRKKTYEHRLEQTAAQMMTIEQEISSIETANINKETFVAMQNAKAAIQQIHGKLTIEKIDQTMEDLRDQHAIGEEIAEALTQGATGHVIDDEELDEELKELQEEELDNKMLKTGTLPINDQLNRLPNVNVGEPKLKEDDEEEELRKLQAEMAM